MIGPAHLPPEMRLPELYDPIIQLRRTLFGFVDHIGDILADSPLDDAMTRDIRIWHQNFFEAVKLKNVDLEEVLNTFLDLLEKILIVPVYNFPLDEESMLGSDGHVYGNKFLCVHRYRSEPPFNQCSPLLRDPEIPFTVEPHLIVRKLVCWLKQYRPFFGSAVIEEEYNAIPKEAPPVIQEKAVLSAKSRTRMARIQKIQQQQAARRREAEERESARMEKMDAIEDIVDEVIDRQLAPFREYIVESHAAADQKLDAIGEHIDVLREQYNKLDEDLVILDRDIGNLKKELKETGDIVSSVKADNIRLQVSIKETEQAIKDRDKGILGELLKAAAIIAVCWFASWAATQILGAMSAAGGAAAGGSAAGGTAAAAATAPKVVFSAGSNAIKVGLTFPF